MDTTRTKTSNSIAPPLVPSPCPSEKQHVGRQRSFPSAVAPSLEGVPTNGPLKTTPSVHLPPPHCSLLYSHPLWGRGQSKGRGGQRETGSDNKASQKTDLKEYVASPRGWQRHSQTPGMSVSWLPRGQFLYLQGGLPSGAGLESQASSLTSLSPWASQPRPQNSFPLAARSQCLEQSGCAQQSRSGRPDGGGGFMRLFQTLS